MSNYLRAQRKDKRLTNLTRHQFADMEVSWHTSDSFFQPLTPTQLTAKPVAAVCTDRGIEYFYA